MSRSPTQPFTDRSMWRRLIARSHPDTGGDHELCIWAKALQEAVLSGEITEEPPRSNRAGSGWRYEPPPRSEPAWIYEEGRIPFPAWTDFEALTGRALAAAGEQDPIYASLLNLLSDCFESPVFEEKQRRGAGYKMLAALAHTTGMSKSERVRWYRLAESIPLSDRHAGHILGRLKQ